jgi:hypothetical protein
MPGIQKALNGWGRRTVKGDRFISPVFFNLIDDSSLLGVGAR